jgi:hypothetical protein
MTSKGKSNVASECGDAAMAKMSAHDASVCQSGYAAQQWAKESGVQGYVTVDIGKSGWAANYIVGASGNGKADFGQADLIFWGRTKSTYGKSSRTTFTGRRTARWTSPTICPKCRAISSPRVTSGTC